MTAILDKIIACPSLPTLPVVAMEVLEMMRDPDVSVKALASVVENDQVISAKVLRTINSSYYGLASPCPTIQRAMGYLGLKTVRSLVLGFSLVESFKGCDNGAGFDFQAHWRRAIYSASSARTTAHQTCCTDPDEAFIASMLQDIGMLAASISLGDEYNSAVVRNECDHFNVEAIERERFGFTHSEAGALMAERWRLPESMVEAIRFHHKPELAKPEHKDLVQMVSLSTIAAESLTVKSPATLLVRFKKLSMDWFDLPVNSVQELLTNISSGAQELSRLFQLDTGAAPNLNPIIADEKAQTAADKGETEPKKDRRKEPIGFDELAGIADRAQFDLQLEWAFAAAKVGAPLAVILLEADKLHSANEMYGHQADDAALVEVAKRTTEAIGDHASVFRFHGPMFAVIAPNTDRSVARKLAEDIRNAVGSKPFDLREAPDCQELLPITISLGVTTIDEASRDTFPDPPAMLKAARTAILAAKKAGGNCSRVHQTSKAKRPAAPKIERRASASASATNTTQISPWARGRGPVSVLLVEDDSLNETVVKAALAGVGHVDACAVSTGQAALELLGIDGEQCAETGMIPDILLCHLDLPDISATDLIWRIRESPRHATMPLITFSDSYSPEDAKISMAAGANAFFPLRRFAEDPIAAIDHLLGLWIPAGPSG